MKTPAKADDIKAQIVKNSDLLAMPGAVSEILDSISRDDISIESLSKTISQDPALTGRLLRITNSPYYGLSHRVNSIQHAVMVMGMTTVKCLTLSAALFSPKILPGDFGIGMRALYGNFLAVATTCRKLAVACKYEAPEDAFTCGLLLHIGLLYFLEHYPEKYGEIIKTARRMGSVVDAEKMVLGISHCEVGYLMVQKWGLPENIALAIRNHDSTGNKSGRTLDDITRLAIVLNHDVVLESSQQIEEKISRISAVSGRLGISEEDLVEISSTILKDTIEFAELIEVEVEDYEAILTRANKEIFSTYLSLHRLFKERQELTRRILNEERAKGILEAKQIATSTLAHYINNASMEISGHSQILRMALDSKTPEEICATLPKELDVIDKAIQKTVAVMEEISELNILDEMEFFEKSKILNIDDKIKERIANLGNALR